MKFDSKNWINLLLVSLVLYCGSTYSQSPSFNLDKYWYLRWRLKNYFMVAGEGYGKSTPAGIRNSAQGDIIYNNVSIDTYSQNLHFGDIPNYLGPYIGVLATEYNLLAENNEPYFETLTELYYAIIAVNRLDNCEAQYPWNLPANALDGCMSRGDVPKTFVMDHYLQLNQNLNKFNGNPGDPRVDNPVKYGSSYEYRDAAIFEDRDGGLMSQDHLSSILVGMALVKKFVPEGVTINGLDLHNEAKMITSRILGYMNRCNWVLKDPNDINISQAWGSISWPMSYGFAKAASFIWPQKTLEFMTAIPIANKPIWDGLGGAVLTGSDVCSFLNWQNCQTVSTTWIALNLACVGNSWETVPALAGTLSGPNAVVVGASCFIPGVDCSQAIIWGHSKTYNWEAYYPLLHSVLHNSVCLTDQSSIIEVLNTMPCSGNYFGRDVLLTQDRPFGWLTSLRFHNTPFENDNGDSEPSPIDSAVNTIYANEGIYTGLEYMLIFNMFNISQNGDYVEYKKGSVHSDIFVTGNVPFINPWPLPPWIIGVGAESNSSAFLGTPQLLKSNGTITSNAVIENKTLSGTYQSMPLGETNTVTVTLQPTPVQANVTYRAGESVILKDGFHAKAGSKFHAFIQPYVCNGSGTAYQRRGNDQGKEGNAGSEEVPPPIVLAASEKQDDNGNPLERFIVYPNPNNGQFFIELESNSLSATTEVFISDVLGKIVWNTHDSKGFGQVSQKWEVDMKSLTKGVYYVTTTSGQIQKTARIVIQ